MGLEERKYRKISVDYFSKKFGSINKEMNGIATWVFFSFLRMERLNMYVSQKKGTFTKWGPIYITLGELTGKDPKR